MFNRISTETMNWILIIGIILFIIEVTFFHGGLIITAIIMAALAFWGWKTYSTTLGKVFFWTSSIVIIIIFLNMNAVRFLVLVCLVLFVLDYYKTKRTTYLSPEHSQENIIYPEEPIVKMNPLFKQSIFGNQYTSQTPYEWRDINIHGGIGDLKIDLSNAVIQDDTAIISIRHGIGNITIYIPYDMEFMIHHSAIFGRTYILHQKHLELINQQVSYKTEDYHKAQTRVKISTTLISGNIEVKRI